MNDIKYLRTILCNILETVVLPKTKTFVSGDNNTVITIIKFFTSFTFKIQQFIRDL